MTSSHRLVHKYVIHFCDLTRRYNFCVFQCRYLGLLFRNQPQTRWCHQNIRRQTR